MDGALPVDVTHKPSGKTLEAIGGTGLEWLGLFEEELREGVFE